jgi:hypothetical protein
VTQAERATKDKAAIKLRVDELEKSEAQRMKMIEEAMEVQIIFIVYILWRLKFNSRMQAYRDRSVPNWSRISNVNWKRFARRTRAS